MESSMDFGVLKEAADKASRLMKALSNPDRLVLRVQAGERLTSRALAVE